MILHSPIGILGQVWFLIVSIHDFCPLSYLLYAKIKDADQPVHLHSLVCIFVIRSFENIVAKLNTCKIVTFNLVSNT